MKTMQTYAKLFEHKRYQIDCNWPLLKYNHELYATGHQQAMFVKRQSPLFGVTNGASNRVTFTQLNPSKPLICLFF